ncbi:kinetochore protein Spc25 [Neosynchiropus ocellatus]
MASITDHDMIDGFTKTLEEFHHKQQTAYGEIIDSVTELCQSHRHFVKSALDASLTKCKDDDIMFVKIESHKKESQQKSGLLKSKHAAVADVALEIQHKDAYKDKLIQQIEKLKEDQVKRREMILSQTKANKNKLKNLQKARIVFENHLGLEIRKIRENAQMDGGEKLQFVYRNINPANLDSAYVVTMGIRKDGVYQIMSSDPQLECLPDLEKRLQETNNLPVFLANVRKAFISVAEDGKNI